MASAIAVPQGKLEDEFQGFLRASYEGLQLAEDQILQLRCAFYGGAMIGYTADASLVTEFSAHMRYIGAINAAEKGSSDAQQPA